MQIISQNVTPFRFPYIFCDLTPQEKPDMNQIPCAWQKLTCWWEHAAVEMKPELSLQPEFSFPSELAAQAPQGVSCLGVGQQHPGSHCKVSYMKL